MSSQLLSARPSMSRAAWATLNTASAIGTVGGQGGTRGLGVEALLRDHEHCLEAHRWLEPVDPGSVADDEPAVQRRGGVVRVAFELGRQAASHRRRARRCGQPPTARPRSPPRSSRARPTAGSPSRSGTRSRPPDAAARRHARQGWSGLGARRARSATAKLPVSCTSSSRCSESAAPSTSKPGPRLAEEAGTRTRRRRRRVISRAPLPRARKAQGHTGSPLSACSSATWGSLSPWPVRTQTTRRASPGPCVRRPATLAAEAGSQKMPSSRASSR